MAVFVILSDPESLRIGEAVQQIYGAESVNLAPGQWLVSSKDKKTTKEVLESIGAVGGKLGRVIAFAISGYNGFHRPDVWEWIKARWD